MGILIGARIGRVCLVLGDEVGLLVRLKTSERQRGFVILVEIDIETAVR